MDRRSLPSMIVRPRIAPRGLASAGIGLAFIVLSGCEHPSHLEGDDPGAALVEEITRGQVLFEANCAACHEGQGVSKAPHRSMMAWMTADMVVQTLTTGVMAQQAAHLSPADREAVAAYVAPGVGGSPRLSDRGKVRQPRIVNDSPPVACTSAAEAPPSLNVPVYLWGFDERNSRFISADVARLESADLKKLTLKWAFAYPRSNRARSQPVLYGDRIIVGSQSGAVHALDTETGCVRWSYQGNVEVRTGATVIARNEQLGIPSDMLVFGDMLAFVHAVDAATGTLLWRVKVDDHPSATVTAQPTYADGRIFVPVSSLEVGAAVQSSYPCCTFRGAIVALDPHTGKQIWKTHTIPDAPSARGVNTKGTPQFGPSGAPVWNTPAIDTKRKRLYFGTGENYSSPADGNSDAVFALDMQSGAIVWRTQTIAGDAWNVACMRDVTTDQSNCPQEDGPDYDFGAATMLLSIGGKDLVIAGQKSGDVWAFDAEHEGRIVWRQKVGRGGTQGGVHFGIANNGSTVFVPISDMDDKKVHDAPAQPGMVALDALSGRILWRNLADDVCNGREFCDAGIAAAITATAHYVLAGHMDGRLRAYEAGTGAVLWEFDTSQEVQTLSGVSAHGGSMGGASGPLVRDGTLFVNSGYGVNFHMPGNVLLAFAVRKDEAGQ